MSNNNFRVLKLRSGENIMGKLVDSNKTYVKINYPMEVKQMHHINGFGDGLVFGPVLVRRNRYRYRSRLGYRVFYQGILKGGIGPHPEEIGPVYPHDGGIIQRAQPHPDG